MIERAITSKTRAIIPVHYAGRVADMDRIMKIAHKHDLIVLEDACHAWGSRWNGVGAGVLGHAGVFSFQMSKNLSAGEGGAIVTNDTELATHIRKHTNIGMPPGHRHYHECVGTNARITEFQAALLSAQLTRLDEQTELRMQNAAVLENGIDEIEGLSYPLGDERINRRSYHYFCIEITPEEFGCSRDRFLEAANAEGVTILPPYPEPIYNQPACQGEGIYRKLDCPQTEALCQQTGCWIPHHVLLARLQDMQDILTIFKKIKNSVNRQVV
jgi:dTDP-4-amino-4,6-dideoxygalactose transaminase